MNTAELKEYLGIVVDMEKNIYLQKHLISNFDREIETLKISPKFTNPERPSHPGSAVDYPVGRIILGCVGIFFLLGFLGTIIAGICAAINKVALAQYSWMTLPALVLPIIYALAEIRGVKETNNRLKLAEVEYQKELKQYQQEIAEIEVKRQQDEENRNAKIMIVEEERAKAENALAVSTQHLQVIYDKNIIFPKYRNLVMTCSLYEYICAGRCSELEGHEGAYNILETEIRLDKIITQLSRIIVQLGAIQQNQFMLYSAIQESNQRSSQILESTNRMADSLKHSSEEINILTGRLAELQKTSELTAYCAERTQKELAYMNRMNYLSGRNDGVFWNVPPT